MTLGALRDWGWESRSVAEEMAANLEGLISSGTPLSTAVQGFENTVLPQLETAILAEHDIILLGERGQAKTRLIRSLIGLLDEWMPIVAGSEINDDPFSPVSAQARALVAAQGDNTPIAWRHRSERYGEKLATPDTTIADLIGEVDPIKVAEGRYLSDELTIHYGLVPRVNRGIFAINELPDLAERIQVGLLNVLEERDIQIRGHRVRLPLDIVLVATANPEDYTKRAEESMAKHVQAMVGYMAKGAEVFDYGNSIRDEARKGGYKDAFKFPGFIPAYIRPLFCEGKGPFRWVALSGDKQDIYRTDKAILELFPENDHLRRWITMAQDRVQFQGLPARICWLGYGERDKAGAVFNDLVKNGEVSAPIVIGRDHLDCGSVASPYRESEGMIDGSDAIADWPLLNAMVNIASGASWVSIHHGGGVGIGRSIHAGQVSVADGTELAAQKLARVLTNDPGMGVIRHVDAGYPEAVQVARQKHVHVPMLDTED